MKRRCFVGGVLALLLCCTAIVGGASAQGGGGRRGGMMNRGGLQMLRIPEVQKELKMTPEQVGKLDAKQDEVRQAMQGGGNPAEMTPDERTKRAEKMYEIQTKAVAGVLDAEQMKRYRQLDLQQMGPSALARADVAAELKLTDEQKKQVADAQRKAMDDQRAAMQGGGNPAEMTPDERTKWMAKMQEVRKASDEKLAAVLTDAQKAQWKEMLGTPFTFPAPAPGGFGGGGRRPGA